MSETQLAERPVPKAPVLTGTRGLHFSNLDELWRFAVAVSNSRQFKGIDTPEIALILLQAGLEIGLSPVWSLANLFVVNNRPVVFGDALLGIVQAHPQCEDVIETMEGDGDQMVATCEVHRKGRVPIKRTFNVRDAKRAGLWGKSGPWSSYPQRMLAMRARSWACRDAFADALRGLGVVEEYRDIEPKPITAREIERPKLVLPDEPEGGDASCAPVQVETQDSADAIPTQRDTTHSTEPAPPVGASPAAPKSDPESAAPISEEEERWDAERGEFII